MRSRWPKMANARQQAGLPEEISRSLLPHSTTFGLTSATLSPFSAPTTHGSSCASTTKRPAQQAPGRRCYLE